MYKAIGIQASSGEYEGNSYNNIYIHATYTDEKKITGMGVKKIKVRASVYTQFLVKVGQTFDAYYDEFGNVTLLTIKQ